MPEARRGYAPALYAISDRRSMPQGLVEAAVGAARAGADAIQLREKDLDAAEVYELACELVRRLAPFDARLFVNDRPDIASAAGAAGVQLRVDSLPASDARRTFPGLLIGASVHGSEEALRAEREGADFLLLGPIFDTPSKRPFGPPLGLETLRAIASATRLPVVAVGGITPERAASARAAGAAGVAAIRAIWERPEAAGAFRDPSRLAPRPGPE